MRHGRILDLNQSPSDQTGCRLGADKVKFNKLSIRWLIIISMISAFLIPAQIANASEPWKINVLSSLKDIDQFENRELVFEVQISDKKVIEFLNRPNTEIIGLAVLAPLETPTLATLENNTSNIYTCYNPKPKALSGLTGGSALRMQKSGDANEIIAKFSCWFPIGMRAQDYTLTISLSLNLNSSCCSMPVPNEWDNQQLFLFGNAPDNFRPNWLWQRQERNSWITPPYVTLNKLTQFERISVVRSQAKTDPANLTFNSKNISEMTEGLKKKIEIENARSKDFENSLNKLNGLASKTQGNIKNLLSASAKSKYLKDASELKNNSDKIIAQLNSIKSEFEKLSPGSLADDIRLKYLYGLDFDIKSKPEVLVAQYPNFKTVNSSPTPYLRFIVKSKTAIINAAISPVFSSNVITLGSQPINDGWGGGLALVENQQWDGSMFISSILVGPKYTPLDSDSMNRLRSETCTSGWFLDAAGNISTYWNYDIPKLQCLPIPAPTQAASAEKDFDNLVILYRDLAKANEDFQNVKVLSSSLTSKTSLFSLFTSQLELINSQSQLLAAQVKTESATVNKLKVISCVNKKKTIQISGISPKCPAGFTKK